MFFKSNSGNQANFDLKNNGSCNLLIYTDLQSQKVSTVLALRLARYFKTSDRFWLNLQTRYDLELEKDRLGERLETEVLVD